MPVPKNASSVIPNTSAVGPRPEPSSSAIASKKAPNVYTVPKATPAPIAAATTTVHPRARVHVPVRIHVRQHGPAPPRPD